MYGLPGSSISIPSRADLLKLPPDLLNSMIKRRNFEEAEESFQLSFGDAVTSRFLDAFRKRLENNPDLSDAFYGEAYESQKDEHFFNLAEYHKRFDNIDPYSVQDKHFTADQQKERMVLLVESCWDTFIDPSGSLPCPTLVWDAQNTANRNYYDREKNELHITASDYRHPETSAQAMLACVLSHSIDLTSEGKLIGGFGDYALPTINKTPEHVKNPEVDVTRAEMQEIFCRKASKIFLDSAERAMREHLFTDIEDSSLHDLNPRQRTSLLKEVHPVGTCYDSDGTDPKYIKSFFSSEAKKNAFILRVNANCPMDETYQSMCDTARDLFLKSDDAAKFRSEWGLFPQYRRAEYKLVEKTLSAIEQAWRNAAQEAVVLTDQTMLPVYFGLMQDAWAVKYNKNPHDGEIRIGSDRYQIAKTYRKKDADESIRVVPHFNWKSNFSTGLYIQQGQYGDAGTYKTRETRGHIIHIPYTENHWFWKTEPDKALEYLGWLYIQALNHRIKDAYMKGDSYCGAEKATFHPDNPFYAYAQRIGNWHTAGDLARLDWMVSRIPGHEREGPSQRLADNFLKKPIAPPPSPRIKMGYL